jgi:hypothetical protein
MESTFAMLAEDRHLGGWPNRRARSILGRNHPTLLLIALLVGLLSWETALPPSASAGSSEQRLLSITKTTVYGALLGGILGLASALVVREGYEDDAIRWGVAVGAFSGFIYGAMSPDETDDFSLDALHEPKPLVGVSPDLRGEAAGPGGFEFSGGGPSHKSSPSIGAPLSLDHAWSASPEEIETTDHRGFRTNQRR